MQEQYIHIDKYGNKFYYKDRKMKNLHRNDGPAIEYADGGKEWCVDGQLHRADGPAIECVAGYREWWVNGEKLTEKLTEKQFNPLSAQTLELTLEEIAAKLGVDVSKLKIVK